MKYILNAFFLAQDETLILGGKGSESEKAVLAHKDKDKNTVDVFYVDTFNSVLGWKPGYYGYAYTAEGNKTKDPTNSNFIVMGNPDSSWGILSHELMHVLLDLDHRNGEPETALFNKATEVKENKVSGQKRIGPYPDAAKARVGNDDTFTIRSHAETLPE